MNYKKGIIIIASFLLIFSFSWLYFTNFFSYTNSHSYPQENKSLESALIDSTIYFKLDETSTPESLTYGEFDESYSMFRFLNILDKSILNFNSKNRLSFQKIKLSELGLSNNGKIQGFHYLNNDSIIVYDYNNAKLSLLSESKGLRWSKSMYGLRGNSFEKVYPYVTYSSPLIYSDSVQQVIATGFFGDEGSFQKQDSKRKVLAKLNLQSMELDYSIPYPSFYWGKNWAGISGFRQPFHTFNKRLNKLVISFPADHELTVVNLTSQNSDTFFAGSRKFNAISSMKQAPFLFDFISGHEKVDFYTESNSYGPVTYDSNKDLYLRVAKLANASSDKNKSYFLIILDHKFNYKGEFFLPKELNPFRTISTPDGVWYLNAKESDINQIAFSRINLSNTIK